MATKLPAPQAPELDQNCRASQPASQPARPVRDDVKTLGENGAKRKRNLGPQQEGSMGLVLSQVRRQPSKAHPEFEDELALPA
jgi:hypothetical protein